MIKFPVLPAKEFFTMGEVALIAQVPAHTLRYWEKEIGALRPTRLSSGHRRYTKADLETIFRIKELIGSQKMTSMGARQALKKRRWPNSKDAGSEQPALTAGASRPTSAPSEGTLEILREIRKEIGSLLEEMK